jgi:hypothetical protein
MGAESIRLTTCLACFNIITFNVSIVIIISIFTTFASESSVSSNSNVPLTTVHGFIRPSNFAASR